MVENSWLFCQSEIGSPIFNLKIYTCNRKKLVPSNTTKLFTEWNKSLEKTWEAQVNVPHPI